METRQGEEEVLGGRGKRKEDEWLLRGERKSSSMKK
jgi:hypothetical protein